MKTLIPFTKTYHSLGLVLFFLFASPALFAQNIGINVTGATPSQNAILDLNTGNAQNLGLLIPRVVLGSNPNTFSPPMANNPSGLDSGMMVYNWQATNQPIGYYYWNGGVTGTWTSIGSSGGVTSITGTAPVFVTPSTGAAVVSLQGTAGTVFYGTGGGSNFTLAGTAPAGTTASASSNYLQSQGAAAPKWVQPVARVSIPLDAIGVAATVGKYYVGVEGGAASLNFASPTPIAGGDAAGDLGMGFIATSNGTFSKANGWVEVGTIMSVTISVYKYTPVNGQLGATTIAGTLLGSTTVVASATNTTYSFEVDGNAGTTFNKGDWIVVFSNVSVAGNLFNSGTMEVTYNVQ